MDEGRVTQIDGAGDDLIAHQAREIERLRRRLEDERFAEDLREAMTVAMAASTIATPAEHAHLLQLIVETAANVISAQAASLLLVDKETNELIFEVAVGGKPKEVKEIRVPLGHGVAGLVALTGQAMAVADAQKDERVAADIADRVGYWPQTLLCVPLFYRNQIFGVFELLDKKGGAPFTSDDMAALGLFANQAAVAIAQSTTSHQITGLIRDVLQSFIGISDQKKRTLQADAALFADRLQVEDPAYRRSLHLAHTVYEIASRGEHEYRACEAILKDFREYLQSRPGPTVPSGVFR